MSLVDPVSVDPPRPQGRHTKLAVWAFVFLVIQGGAIIWWGIAEAVDKAAAIEKMSGFLLTYFGGLVSVVLGKFGVDAYESTAVSVARARRTSPLDAGTSQRAVD